MGTNRSTIESVIKHAQLIPKACVPYRIEYLFALVKSDKSRVSSMCANIQSIDNQFLKELCALNQRIKLKKAELHALLEREHELSLA